jgi:hypothetical protein
MHNLLFVIIIEMNHPFEILLRIAKVVGFVEGLQKGCRDPEKELADLQEYVEQAAAGESTSQGGQLASYHGYENSARQTGEFQYDLWAEAS